MKKSEIYFHESANFPVSEMTYVNYQMFDLRLDLSLRPITPPLQQNFRSSLSRNGPRAEDLHIAAMYRERDQ